MFSTDVTIHFKENILNPSLVEFMNVEPTDITLHIWRADCICNIYL